MDRSENTPLRTISLCSGYGGAEIGIELAGQPITPILICEIESYPLAVASTKMQKGQIPSCPMFTDLTKLCGKPYEGHTDLLTAGFPCQPFSVAGKKEGVKDPRHIFPDILRIIEECKPERVFFENVIGIISTKTAMGESVLLHVLRQLEQRGYTCSWGIFSAEQVGARHQRKRVYILEKRSEGF